MFCQVDGFCETTSTVVIGTAQASVASMGFEPVSFQSIHAAQWLAAVVVTAAMRTGLCPAGAPPGSPGTVTGMDAAVRGHCGRVQHRIVRKVLWGVGVQTRPLLLRSCDHLVIRVKMSVVSAFRSGVTGGGQKSQGVRAGCPVTAVWPLQAMNRQRMGLRVPVSQLCDPVRRARLFFVLKCFTQPSGLQLQCFFLVRVFRCVIGAPGWLHRFVPPSCGQVKGFSPAWTGNGKVSFQVT